MFLQDSVRTAAIPDVQRDHAKRTDVSKLLSPKSNIDKGQTDLCFTTTIGLAYISFTPRRREYALQRTTYRQALWNVHLRHPRRRFLKQLCSQMFAHNEPVNLPRSLMPVPYYLPQDVGSRFGVRLRQMRKERSMTQLQMAIAFGIDRSYISDVERGRKNISLPMLEIIALGMKISLSELFRDL